MDTSFTSADNPFVPAASHPTSDDYFPPIDMNSHGSSEDAPIFEKPAAVQVPKTSLPYPRSSSPSSATAHLIGPTHKFSPQVYKTSAGSSLPASMFRCPQHKLLDASLFHQKHLPYIPISVMKELTAIMAYSAQQSQVATLDEEVSSDEEDEESSGSESEVEDFDPLQNFEQDDIPIDPTILLGDIMVTKRRAFAQQQLVQCPATPRLKSELSLLKILNKHKAPLALFSTIQKWAQESARLGHDHNRMPRNREPVIQELEDRFDTRSSRFHPTKVSYLPDERPTLVYVSSFADAVYSLLTDTELTTEENLAFPDPESPFPCLPTDPLLRTTDVSELHHGAWYKNTHQNLCSEAHDVLCPVIFYMDGVATDANGRLGLIPLSMTLGIFNVATRARKEAWVTIYYHPDDEAEASLHTKETLAIHKVINLHRGLDAAFAEFRNITAAGGLKWDKLRYGGKDHQVNFKFVFTYMVGDTEMHDKVCGRYNNRVNVQCLCRHCDCPLEESVNGSYRANLFESTKLDRKLRANNLDYFKSISHHPIQNAFHKLDFGSNRYNIHLASPGELLHMHQKGMMVRFVEGLKNLILSKSKESDKVSRRIRESLKAFDTLSLRYGGLLSRSSERDFPRTKFKNSLFSGTKKAAHEQAGVLLNLLLGMLSDRGRQILVYERTLLLTYVQDQILMCEICLGLEEWMKKTSYTAREIRNVPDAMRYVIDNVKATSQRGGMGNLLIKNHLYFHLHDYMKMWGPLRQMNSGPNESHHKTEVKAPSMNTQRRPATFVQQTSKRYTEIRLIRTACRHLGMSDTQILANTPPMNQNRNIAVTGAKYSIGYVDDIPSMRWESKSHWNRTSIHPSVIELVCAVIPPLLPPNIGTLEHVVPCFTEHKRERDNQRCIFRAHPCYRSKEAHPKDVWYDWAFFDTGDPEGPLPCQILCLLDLALLPTQTHQAYRGFIISEPGQYAVVRKFKHPPACIRFLEEGGISSLVRWGDLEEGFFVFDCETITDLACVVPNLPIVAWEVSRKANKKRDRSEIQLEAAVGPIGGYYVVTPKAKWGEWFTNSIVLQNGI